jgi:hypothetical protein
MKSTLSQIEGLRISTLQLVDARCRADGGVVLIFEQRSFPPFSSSYAYAVTGKWPPQEWAGGTDQSEPLSSEVLYFLQDGEVPC